MNRPLSERFTRDDFLLVALCNIFWAPLNLFVQMATGNGFPPVLLAASRWTIVTLGVAVLIRSRRAPLPEVRGRWIAFGLGALCFGPAHALFYIGLNYTTPTEGVVLGTTAPIFTSVLVWLILKERLTWQRWMGIALGAAGAYIVLMGFRLPHFESNHILGNGLYTLAVFLECVVGVITAAIVRRSSGIGVLGFQTAGGAASLILIALLTGATVFPASTLAWTGWAYLVFVGGLFNFSIWYGLVERLPLSLLVLSLLAQPPISAFIEWITLGREPKLETYVGTVLIFAALIIGTVFATPSRRKSDASPSP